MENKSGGISVFGVLGCLFVGLKLTNYIDWSWWYVTAPFWGLIALVLAVFLIIMIVYVVKSLFQGS